MAKRSSRSYGDGHHQLDFHLDVVPGITISFRRGSFTVPVTSVVRK